MTTVSYSESGMGMDLDQLSVGSHPIHKNNEKDSVLIVKWKQKEETTNSLNRPRGGTGLM